MRPRHFRTALPRLGRAASLALVLLAAAVVAVPRAEAQTAPQVGAQPGAYTLTRGDRIGVRIVSWDSLQLSFVQLNELGGEYAVGQDGKVMLPLVGPVDAAGLTAAELARSLSERLNERMALSEPPSTSVEVLEYAPIYVIGDIQGPGTYQYRPGITAIQALALAGGFYRVNSGNAYEVTNTIRTTGNLRELQIDQARLRIRAARLQAEADGRDAFGTPAGLRSPEGPQVIEALMRQEQVLFESRRETLENALASLEDTKRLLETEIAAREEKLIGQERQIELVAQSVGNLESLVERGLARSPNLMALQQTLIDLESQTLDTETGIFRAQQQISELERDRVDLAAERQLQTLRELQQTEAELDRLATRIVVARDVLLETGAAAVTTGEVDEASVAVAEFRIVREIGGTTEEIEADANTKLMPLDVLEITTASPLTEDLPAEPEG